MGEVRGVPGEEMGDIGETKGVLLWQVPGEEMGDIGETMGVLLWQRNAPVAEFVLCVGG